MDETWLSLKKSKVQVIVPREWTEASMMDIDLKLPHVTMVMCVSADGEHCKTLAVLPKLQAFPQDLEEYRGRFHFSSSTSGWITTEIFENLI